jgi:hypothetical protein
MPPDTHHCRLPVTPVTSEHVDLPPVVRTAFASLPMHTCRLTSALDYIDTWPHM